ncbi:MAG: hypothetical protein M3Y82_04775, partial [Verrucomicrobiota bacterium]|nr:hypothetical protein [Verrucomicrobiota bacterium]
SSTTGWRVVGVKDFNGDGQIDIFWENTNGRQAVWLMKENEFLSNTYLRNGQAVPSIWKFAGIF